MRIRLTYLLLLPLMLIGCRQAADEFAFEQRCGYKVAKITLPTDASSEAQATEAYFLLPDTIPHDGCPAVLLFHDHGAWFTIGKEKLVRPISADSALFEQSDYWVGKFYEGAYVADSLAANGYAVLVADALYWGSRSVVADSVRTILQEGNDLPFAEIKALNKRLKNDQPSFYSAHLSSTGEHWFETILREDKAALTWLLSRPEVNPERVGVAGFSLGAYRAWMLAAEDNRPAWCFAANWMTTMEAHGGPLPDVSAYSMYRPMLDSVDYPAIAARAAERPLMLLYGADDPLFPVASVQEAIDSISAAPGAQLTPVEIPAPHRFTRESLICLLTFAGINNYFHFLR